MVERALDAFERLGPLMDYLIMPVLIIVMLLLGVAIKQATRRY